MFDVVTIGAATIDIFVKSEALKIINSDTLSLASSSKNEISQSLIASGGGATNAAVSFSRLGLKVGCCALIGNDPLSQYIVSDLVKNKVTSSFITRETNLSDFSVILVAPDGSRSILANRGSTSLQEKNLHWQKITKVKWFYLSSLEGNFDLLEKIIGFAVDHEINISLNPGNRELSNLKRLSPLLKYVNFLLLNKSESELITNTLSTDASYWQKLKNLSPHYIAVTKGREGAHILSPLGDFYSPIRNIKPVDETGAGDAFGSTFVAALIHQQTPSEALAWAITNSASVVSYLGAKPGLLTLKQIKASHVA